ncbi:unnamed protein product [Sphagnum compactum]
MAHRLSPLHIFKRRRHGMVATAPPPSPSAMSLVKALLGLTRLVVVCGKPQVLQRRNASNIARRIELLASLFEEILDLRLPLPPSVVQSFQELYTILSGAKLLLDDCREASLFCLLIEQESVAQQFYDLTQSMAVVLDSLPLELLDLQAEVKEQIELVRIQVRRAAELFLDPGELQLREEVLAMLGTVERKERLEISHLRELFSRLQLLSVRDCQIEMQRLEDLRSASHNNNSTQRQVAEKLTSFICFLRYGRCILYGISQAVEDDDNDAAARRRNSATASSSSKTTILGDEVSSRDAEAAAISPPEEFLCPINLEIMRDPVIVATGQTYERASITRWLQAGHHTCPKSGQDLRDLKLTPNFALRSVISQWCTENKVPFEKLDNKRSSTRRKNNDNLANNGVALEATKLTAAFLTEKLGSDSSPEAQKQAAYELRLLAKGGTDNRICIADAGAIPLLVPLLSSMDPKTQENAVTALLNLSICECNKIPIVECGASEAIIEVLKNGSTMQSRENAAATVFSLAVNDDLKVVIGNTTDAIPALVTLLREGTASRGKRDATTALYNLAIHKGNQAGIVRAGVVPLLVSLLLTTDQEQEQEQETTAIIEEALALLALVAETTEGVTAITDACAIPILVKLLRSASSKAKEHAIVVLLFLCKIGGDAVIKTVVKCSSVVPSTYNLFTMGSTPRVKRKAGSLLKLLYNWKSASDKAPAAVH